MQRLAYPGSNRNGIVMTRTRRFKALLLTLLVLWVGAASAQSSRQDRPALNYGFVSANTRNDLTIDDAINKLYSEEESQLIRQIAELGCRMRSQPRTTRALGSWSDGAEHSVLVRVNTDEPSIRYLLARLGQDAKQKSVLYFHVHANGPDRLYILRPRKLNNLKSIARALDRDGIAFRTLVPTHRGSLVYIVDLHQQLRPKVLTAARRLRSRVTLRTGNGEFIGDSDDAGKANEVFDQEIKSYESTRGPLDPKCR
jgi:hypothetical protein